MSAQALVGVWRLEEFVLRTGSSESRPFGERPKGRLHVSADGQLLVSILAEQRARFRSDDMQAGTPEEAVAALRSALGYFGRWHFDPESSMLRTKVEGALFPNLEGTVQERHVALRGRDQLVLTTPPVAWQGQDQRGVLRWSRAG